MSHIDFLGHATTIIEVDGTKILTDPVLRPRAGGLIHRNKHVFGEVPTIDVVVISHLHHDHLDVPTLQKLGRHTRLLVPREGGALLRRRGFTNVREMDAGDAVDIGSARIVATPAVHVGYRAPFGPLGGTLGYIVEGGQRVYFAGDTQTFPEMSQLGAIDVALMPVAGWGPVLGPGHMNPAAAVDALELIKPSVAIPIHWGSLVPFGLHLRGWSYLTQPPLDFAELTRQRLPDVTVHVLQAGESFDF